jgi:hypothetical protein
MACSCNEFRRFIQFFFGCLVWVHTHATPNVVKSICDFVDGLKSVEARANGEHCSNAYRLGTFKNLIQL